MSGELCSEINAANFDVALVGVPKKRLYQYQEQRSDLEFSCTCLGGEVKFSRWISETSGHFDQICEKREPFKGGPIRYDGTESSEPFNVKTIKTYWDLAHEKPLMSLPTVVDLIRFLQYEDKIRHEEFDKKLHDSLMKELLKMTLKAETQLLVAVIFSTFDHPDQRFEKKLVESISFEKLIITAFNWDPTSDSNKELIEVYANSTQSPADKVKDMLVFDVVSHTKNTLSQYFEDVTTEQLVEKKEQDERKQRELDNLKAQVAKLEAALELEGNKIKQIEKTVQDQLKKEMIKMKKTVNDGFKQLRNDIVEGGLIFDLEVTGDTRTNKDNANGRYKVEGWRNDAPYYKRINGPDFFVFRSEFGLAPMKWYMHRDFSDWFTKNDTNGPLPSETGWDFHPESTDSLKLRVKLRK